MIGIVSNTRSKKTKLQTREITPRILCVEMSVKKSAKPVIKTFRKFGITRIAASNDIFNKHGRAFLKQGITPVTGDALSEKLMLRIALKAAQDLWGTLEDVATEVYTGGSDAFDAVRFLGKRLRHLALIGRGSEQLCDKAYSDLGISALNKCIPAEISEKILRLYFNGDNRRFSLKTPLGEKSYSSCKVKIPEKYAEFCPVECRAALAAVLIQQGLLTQEDVEIQEVSVK